MPGFLLCLGMYEILFARFYLAAAVVTAFAMLVRAVLLTRRELSMPNALLRDRPIMVIAARLALLIALAPLWPAALFLYLLRAFMARHDIKMLMYYRVAHDDCPEKIYRTMAYDPEEDGGTIRSGMLTILVGDTVIEHPVHPSGPYDPNYAEFSSEPPKS